MKHRNLVTTDRLSPYESFGEGIRVLDFLPQASGVLNSPAGVGAASITLSSSPGRGLWPCDGGNGRRRRHLPPRGESLQWVTTQMRLLPHQGPAQ